MPSSHSSGTHWLPPGLDDLQKQLPGYEIIHLLGMGGMGAVYEGRQKNLDRRVAIKLLPSALHRSEEGSTLSYAARFRQEAQSMAKLDHPAIVSVFDFGQTDDDNFYFVMEFIDGMDIHQYMHSRGGKLPGKDALAIIAHVLDGLDYAHENGIVHRDIKPANVLISSKGRVKITDFGLAKSFVEGDETPQLTMTNMAIGTPDYVAPEVTQQGTRPDQRADLYAIGVMLYQLLTGEVPRGRWRPPHDVVPGLDPRFGPIIEKALETDPDERYASAAAFRADLDEILTAPKPAETGTAPVRVVKLVTGPVKGKAKGTGTSAARTTDAAEPPVAVVVAEEDGAEAKKKRLVLGAAVGLPVMAVIAILLVISNKADPESVGDSGTDSPSPAAESGKAGSGSRESTEGPYAEIGRRLEQALDEEERQEKRHAADGKPRNDEAKTASADTSDSASQFAAVSKPAPPADVDYPVPSPGEYSAVAIAEAGPPLVGRWRPLLGESEVSRDGSEPKEGDSFLLGCKAAEVELKAATPDLLIRWRGFRGNSMSIEYKGSNNASGRRSFHIGTGGGAPAHLGPPADSGAARRYDHHYYLLIQGDKKYLWEVVEGQDPGVKVGAGQQAAAPDVLKLRVTTWNPHGLPYFKPALFRRCDTMIPTEEQLAELQAARTTANLRALSWIAFPPDEEYDGFLDAVDEVCEKFAGHDFEGALNGATGLLEKHVLLAQNPHGEILTSIRNAAGAVVALQQAAEGDKPLPQLKDNPQYRLDANTGHAFVMVPVFLVRDHAAAFARACGGHLATVSDGESSQGKLLREWLTPLVPLGVFSGTSGRRLQAYHCGGENLDTSGLRWSTGEPSSVEAEGDGPSFPTGYGYLVQEWKARKNEAGKRTMQLSWSLVDDSTFAFPLIEFPAPATRYPNSEFNHPAARDAAPGTTGDPLLDFENRFTHQWREAVEQPQAALEDKLRQKYSDALEQRARAIAQGGDLDAVLPWHFEIETIRAGRQPAALGSDTPEDLRRLRGVWGSEWKKIEAERESSVAQAVAAADSELAAIEKQLVQQKRIDRAAAVQKRRKQIAAREALPGTIGKY